MRIKAEKNKEKTKNKQNGIDSPLLGAAASRLTVSDNEKNVFLLEIYQLFSVIIIILYYINDIPTSLKNVFSFSLSNHRE